ncbi:hypothetical protein Taro_025873 [Colocasia esculenta]|uniref:Uncharacterized protein n=1 Tax=Colocasia esculenta TaxID=4460 RepID=A0A843VBD2_COLES|nr:hypothetical protein [Colocasia esculenta]
MWPDATTSSAIPPVSEVTGVVRAESTTSLRMEAIMEVGRLSAAPSTASSTGGECGASWNQNLTHYEVKEAVERIQLIPVTKNIHTNVLRRRLVTVSLNIKHTKNTITQHKVYLGSDLLSLGVLRPVPEQQLRISLTRVQSPQGRNSTQPSWSSFTPEGNNNTLDTPPGKTTPGLPSQPKGKQHPGYHQVFLHNQRENNTLDTTRSSFTIEGKTTPWIPPGLPSQPMGKLLKEN